MFSFLNRSAPHYLTIRETLARAGVPSAADPAGLTVLERMGSYSGRRVNFFRAFDPTRAEARALHVQAFRDLDGHQELVLGSGHVEREGLVMLDGRPEAEHATPPRELADRAVHTDDERFVFRHGSVKK
ncbi:MAG TPA: hypothetical protein VKV73_15745 [Chloroflexota bacterium]|nr:hypothetical protein [Chloroflexota bacterium]